MKYEWDVDGDGTYDLTSEAPAGEAANPLQGHRYAAPFTGNVAVRVTDKFGHTAVGTVEVTVTKDGDLIDDAQDNCPADRNPEQIDTDKDGIGDVCDPMPHGMPILPPPSTPDNSAPSVPDNSGIPAPDGNASTGATANTQPSAQETMRPKKSASEGVLARTGLSLDVLAGAGALVLAGGLLIARARRS